MIYGVIANTNSQRHQKFTEIGFRIHNVKSNDMHLSNEESFGQLLKKPPRTRTFLRTLWLRIRLAKIPIEKLRCQVMSFSEVLGFSGKTIDFFPPCKFYQIFLDDPQRAHDSFSYWLYRCLIDLKAWTITEEEGGWKNGSLVELIYNVHEKSEIDLKDFSDAKHDLVKAAIDLRVKYYFSLLSSIRQNGYIKTLSPPIKCYREDGLYYLLGGHHRVSALYALGRKEVDLVIASKT